MSMKLFLKHFLFLILCMLEFTPASALESDTDTASATAAVPLTRAQRREMALMDNLHSNQVDTRISAYQKLSSRHDSTTFEILESVLSNETDDLARQELLLARQKIILFIVEKHTIEIY